MMRECDLDDNDPLTLYLKKSPMSGASAVVSSTHANQDMPLSTTDNETDSIRRQRSENINHGEIDIENDDKVEKADVSKQRD